MILVRHYPGEDGVHRVVLLGRLERDDTSALAAVADQVPGDVQEVRFIASKLWADDPEAAQALASLSYELARRDVPRSWIGCLPAVGDALTEAGEGGRLAGPGPDDVRAGASWDGVSPLGPARTDPDRR